MCGELFDQSTDRYNILALAEFLFDNILYDVFFTWSLGHRCGADLFVVQINFVFHITALLVKLIVILSSFCVWHSPGYRSAFSVDVLVIILTFVRLKTFNVNDRYGFQLITYTYLHTRTHIRTHT